MNSYPSPQYRQEDQNQGGILDTLGKIALTAGAGVGLLYGLNPKNRQALKKQIENIAYDQKVVENIQKVRAASKTSPETTTTAFRSERPRGTQVVDLNQISDPWSGEMPIRPVQVSEVPNVQPQRLALPGQQERLALPAVIKEDPYVPASSSEPPSWQSAGNMVGDYGQLYGARRSKETTQAIEQARRQAAADTYVNTIRSNPDSYQLSIPGVNPELIALRSKEGLPSPGELTGIAESRPLSAAPEQGSFALNYNQARGAVAPDVGSRLKAKGLGMAGMPGEGPLEIDFEGRRAAINSPTGEALLKSAGVTAAEAESYWSNKLRSQGLLEETSVEAQKFNQPLVSSQAVEAIDTGADQAAMRVSRTVQRDPGENLAEFELVQDAYEQRGASPVQAADAAVTATEGNVAFTQTDAPVQGPISAQETADAALAEMKARRAEVAARGLRPGTIRYERALAQPFRTSEKVKPQMTGESMAKTALPTGPIRQTVQGVETSNSPSFFSRFLPNIGEDPYSEITQAASGSSIRGRSRVQNQPDQFRQRVDSARRPIEDDVVVRDAGGTNTYSMGEELSELVMNDPDAPASYTRMVRNPYTGEMAAEWAPKGKRVIQMYQGEGQPTKPLYVPQDDPGGIGIYGVERSYAAGPVTKFGENIGDYTGTAQRVPTDLPYTEKRKNSSLTDLSTPQLQAFAKNAVDKNPKAAQAATSELSRRENTKQNLQISESMRRARIEGRDPQSVLREFGIGI
jgi:hypothetical protein